MSNPTEIFAERLAVQTRQHDATDPHLIACHFTAGWLAAVDALNARSLAQDLAPAPATSNPNAWRVFSGGICPCGGEDLIEIRTRDGEVGTEQACRYLWWHDGSGSDIVAWRPAQP